MSYNLDRRVERAQMKAMIKEFQKEAGLSAKQLDMVLVSATRVAGQLALITGLRDRFDRMLGLAAGKYKVPEELDSSSFNNVEADLGSA